MYMFGNALGSLISHGMETAGVNQYMSETWDHIRHSGDTISQGGIPAIVAADHAREATQNQLDDQLRYAAAHHGAGAVAVAPGVTPPAVGGPSVAAPSAPHIFGSDPDDYKSLPDAPATPVTPPPSTLGPAGPGLVKPITPFTPVPMPPPSVPYDPYSDPEFYKHLPDAPVTPPAVHTPVGPSSPAPHIFGSDPDDYKSLPDAPATPSTPDNHLWGSRKEDYDALPDAKPSAPTSPDNHLWGSRREDYDALPDAKPSSPSGLEYPGAYKNFDKHFDLGDGKGSPTDGFKLDPKYAPADKDAAESLLGKIKPKIGGGAGIGPRIATGGGSPDAFVGGQVGEHVRAGDPTPYTNKTDWNSNLSPAERDILAGRGGVHSTGTLNSVHATPQRPEPVSPDFKVQEGTIDAHDWSTMKHVLHSKLGPAFDNLPTDQQNLLEGRLEQDILEHPGKYYELTPRLAKIMENPALYGYDSAKDAGEYVLRHLPDGTVGHTKAFEDLVKTAQGNGKEGALKYFTQAAQKPAADAAAAKPGALKYFTGAAAKPEAATVAAQNTAAAPAVKSGALNYFRQAANQPAAPAASAVVTESKPGALKYFKGPLKMPIGKTDLPDAA